MLLHLFPALAVGLHVLLRVSLDFRLARLAALDRVSQILEPDGQLRSVDIRGIVLRSKKLLGWRARVWPFSRSVTLKITAWVWSWALRSLRLAGPCRARRCGGNLPVVSGARMLPILAWVYRSNSAMAERTLSRCASRTRSSPPTRAVNETDFGAEKVASQPARCSTEVVSLPNCPA